MIKSNDSSSTLLIYNMDFHKQSSVTYKECSEKNMQECYEIFYSKRYRTNTGTFLMTDTLAKLLDSKWIYSGDFNSMKDSNFDVIVTNAFHCISPEFVFDRTYWQKILDTGLKIVPMTFGFRYHKNGEFYLTDDMVYIFRQISERNEIGVRGEKTAEILNSYGIKNIRIVGCHSLFYHNDRNFKIYKKSPSLKEINFNFNQCYSDFYWTHYEFCKYSVPFFKYIKKIYDDKTAKINYTMQTAFFKEWIGYSNFISYDSIKDFLMECGRYYFSVDDWIEGVKSVDMSVGTQFHGNIAAILAGVPTLEICIDDRMRELCKALKIPNIDIKDFDTEKSLEYYYDMIDYSEFNKSYCNLYDNFIDYCLKNGVKLNI